MIQTNERLLYTIFVNVVTWNPHYGLPSESDRVWEEEKKHEIYLNKLEFQRFCNIPFGKTPSTFNFLIRQKSIGKNDKIPFKVIECENCLVNLIILNFVCVCSSWIDCHDLNRFVPMRMIFIGNNKCKSIFNWIACNKLPYFLTEKCTKCEKQLINSAVGRRSISSYQFLCIASARFLC